MEGAQELDGLDDMDDEMEFEDEGDWDDTDDTSFAMPFAAHRQVLFMKPFAQEDEDWDDEAPGFMPEEDVEAYGEDFDEGFSMPYEDQDNPEPGVDESHSCARTAR